MRNEDIKNEHMLLRKTGIDPLDILDQHITDSFIPGEKHFCDGNHEEEDELDHEDEDDTDSIDFVDWLIISQESSFLVVWRVILLFTSIVTPYYYAWIAHGGY